MATKMFSAGDRRLNANNLAETNPVNTPAVRHEFLTTSDFQKTKTHKIAKTAGRGCSWRDNLSGRQGET